MIIISHTVFAQSWYVLVGTFQSQTEAEEMCRYLINSKYPAYILYDSFASEVRIGPYGDLSSANLTKEKLITDKKISAIVIEEENSDSQQLGDFLPGVEITQDTLTSYTDQTAKKIIQLSIELFGHPYRYGGSCIGSGIDCSYYVQKIFKELKVNLPRTSAEQIKVGKNVDRSSLQVGDLVFFKKTYYRRVGKNKKVPYTRINHVGIYLGNDEFIHATVNAKKVTISKLSEPYYEKRFAGARRVF